jgi:hypothetical protein
MRAQRKFARGDAPQISFRPGESNALVRAARTVPLAERGRFYAAVRARLAGMQPGDINDDDVREAAHAVLKEWRTSGGQKAELSFHQQQVIDQHIAGLPAGSRASFAKDFRDALRAKHDVNDVTVAEAVADAELLRLRRRGKP